MLSAYNIVLHALKVRFGRVVRERQLAKAAGIGWRKAWEEALAAGRFADVPFISIEGRSGRFVLTEDLARLLLEHGNIGSPSDGHNPRKTRAPKPPDGHKKPRTKQGAEAAKRAKAEVMAAVRAAKQERLAEKKALAEIARAERLAAREVRARAKAEEARAKEERSRIRIEKLRAAKASHAAKKAAKTRKKDIRAMPSWRA